MDGDRIINSLYPEGKKKSMKKAPGKLKIKFANRDKNKYEAGKAKMYKDGSGAVTYRTKKVTTTYDNTPLGNQRLPKKGQKTVANMYKKGYDKSKNKKNVLNKKK